MSCTAVSFFLANADVVFVTSSTLALVLVVAPATVVEVLLIVFSYFALPLRDLIEDLRVFLGSSLRERRELVVRVDPGKLLVRHTTALSRISAGLQSDRCHWVFSTMLEAEISS